MCLDRPLPPSNVQTPNLAFSPNDVWVIFTPSPSPIDEYIVTATPILGDGSPISQMTTESSLIFTGLFVPGQRYDISVVGRFRGVDSIPAFTTYQFRKSIFNLYL